MASCCESCPSNKQERYYVPIAPETDCQPGDVRRDDLSVERGTCANPLFEAGEDLGPWIFGPGCCDKQTTRTLYDTAHSAEGVTSDVGAVVRGGGCPDDSCPTAPAAPEGQRAKRLETSILSTAPGPNGRNWVPENPVLRLGKERLKPCHAEPFYAIKEAGTRNLAVAVMASLSVDAEDARAAEASKGTACSSSGHTETQRAAQQERAATAAAMSLLASQAKGQIEGLRATFDVTGREAPLKDAKLQADIVNEVTQKKVPMNLPVRFESSDTNQP